MKPLNRGLHYKRTAYKPGLGICFCPACSELTRFGLRVGMHLRDGSPNPNC